MAGSYNNDNFNVVLSFTARCWQPQLGLAELRLEELSGEKTNLVHGIENLIQPAHEDSLYIRS